MPTIFEQDGFGGGKATDVAIITGLKLKSTLST